MIRSSGAGCPWGLGSLLLELGYEDYGQWFLVSRWSDREDGAVYDVSHVWLELRDLDGSVIWTIDATADQFPLWETKPFVAFGRSLLADYFPSLLFERPVSMVASKERDPSFLAPLAHVRKVLLDCEELQ